VLVLRQDAIRDRRLHDRHQLVLRMAVPQIGMFIKPQVQEGNFRRVDERVNGDSFDKPKKRIHRLLKLRPRSKPCVFLVVEVHVVSGYAGYL
jgi:hypothetical protein